MLIFFRSPLSNGKHSDGTNSRATFWNGGREKSTRPISNNIFVDVNTQHSRDKHISAALQRIQREQDAFDEL